MKINFKVRLKNKTFWLTVIPAIITVVYAVLGLLDKQPEIAQETVVKVITTILSVLTVLGVIVDPTTEGLGDSDRAMGYLVPFKKKKGEDDE